MRKLLIFTAVALLNVFTVCAQVYISGPLSGVLEDTTYIVTGDITVEAGDSLVIEAGAELLFEENICLIVNGVLSAMGLVLDSINFVSIDPSMCWNGLDIILSDGISFFEYCYGLFN